MLILLLACGGLLLACGHVDTAPDDTGAPDDTVDLTVQESDLPALGDDQFVLEGPETVVEPGDDVMVCVFGTYTGDDVGLHDVHTYQGAGGHHLQLMGVSTPEADVPDGTVVDCTGDGGQFNMADLEPLGVTNGGAVGGEEIGVSMPLPEGMAVKLDGGQRFVMQSHYINTATTPIRIRDLAVLTTIPEGEVADDMWAAPLIFNRDDFSVPVAGELTTSFECSTNEDWNFLYILGHMHEWGTAFSIERLEGDSWTPFYTLPEWDPVYRDAPQIDYYPDGAMPIASGSSFRTTCSWYNDTDEALTFPHEMCVGLNIVYPQKTTVICDGNGQ